MAEKRKLPTRRESSVKRRASEAPQPQPQPSKRKASTPSAARALPPERIHRPLPTKIKDVDALPTVPSPQPASLSPKEYQSIAESSVLLASLERSKKKWLSDGILERYWTKPKKTKREQIEQRNPPKDSMSKIGPCNIVVGPHIFDAMLYTVKDPNAPPSIQYATPQRPMLHYGYPPNFQAYQPYPNPHMQNTYQPSPAFSPAHPPQPGSQPPASHPARPPNHSHPPAPPQAGHRPSPSQPQTPQTPQTPKPSPDPVIQMLATRAASDPELKALMRVVASSKATQEQLRTFQGHIDELNAIIRRKEQQQQRQQSQAAGSAQARTPQTQQSPPQKPGESPRAQTQQQNQQTPSQTPKVEVQIPPPSSHPPLQTSTPKPNGTPQVKQEPETGAPNRGTPAATPSEPTRASVSSPGPSTQATPGSIPQPKPASPAVRPVPYQQPPQQPPGIRPAPSPYSGPPPPIQSRPPPYASPAAYYRPGPPLPPPRQTYKSVVFEFTSPLTPYGSSTSGHAGSGDRYLFPEYSIVEWQPGGHTLVASFLVIKKVDPNAPFPIEPSGDSAGSRSKGKGSKSKKDKANPHQQQQQQPPSTPSDQKPPPQTDAPPTPDQPPVPLKEYYQPVTFRIFSTNPKVLEPLTRVVKPPDEVRRYMNEVMDRAERAPGGFLALRLPREAERPVVDLEPVENYSNRRRSGTPATRSRLSRGRTVPVEEGEAEESEVAEKGEDRVEEEQVEEEEEELKDYYGFVTGLPPLGA